MTSTGRSKPQRKPAKKAAGKHHSKKESQISSPKILEDKFRGVLETAPDAIIVEEFVNLIIKIRLFKK